MGTGSPLEAPYTLTGPIPAGTWTFVGDGDVLASCDLDFEFVWRRTGAADVQIVDFQHHFDPPPSPHPFVAVPYMDTRVGAAVPAVAGDQLVLRTTVTNAPTNETAYFFNGDGPSNGGPLPYVSLPF